MKFPNEVAAIREIRSKNPTVPAKTLARQIVNSKFQGSLAGYSTLGYRSFLSAYSVIRRYDASQKANVGGTKKARKALVTA